MADRRRIAVFGPSLAALSGVSTHLRVLFGSALAREFELLHFQVGSEGRSESAAGRLARLALSPLQLAWFLLRSGAGTVHLNASMDARGYWRDLAYWGVARLLGRRVVNQVHGGALPQEFFRGHALRTRLLRRFLVSCDAVTVLSSAELRAYRAFDARIKVRLVPNAIDPAGLLEEARAPGDGGPLRIAYLGRLVRSKGLLELVEALALLAGAGREFTLRIAGSGPLETELATAVRAAGLLGRVRFLGPLAGADKARLWLHAEVFALPSHFEGLPYALLEAMAGGCVPVTTRLAAIPDVVREREHGLFVPPRDPRALARALARLDDDRTVLARMSAACRQRVREHYTVERLARDLRELYQAAA
jgi:glycosyltransferase involved in cell wall biosynthesis